MTQKAEISIDIPSDTIVFPYNFKTRKFDIQHYTPEMTQNTLSVKEVTEYLSEVEGHLEGWHKASCPFIIFLINALSVMPAFGFIVFLTQIMPETLSFQQIILTMVVMAATLFGLLLIRIIVLDICNLKQLKVIQEITDKFGLDLDRTASSVQESDYMWSFPVNFPASICLQRHCEEENDNENPVEISLDLLRIEIEREQNKNLIAE